MYPIERKMADDQLNRLIRSIERSTKILKRLPFIRYRYDGDSVESAPLRVRITKMMGYVWQMRWNQDGYSGLIPKYARNGSSKMSEEQKNTLKEKLENRKHTTAQVRSIIMEEFGIEYTMKQV